MEVHIFPEAMRGTGEGFRPFDLAPKSSMTNGNISARVDATTGPKLTVTYKGGEQTIVVDPKTPIVAFEPGAKTDLKPGAAIIARGPEAGGRLDRRRLRPDRQGRARPAHVTGRLSPAKTAGICPDKPPVLAVRQFFCGAIQFMRASSSPIEAEPVSSATGFVIYLRSRQADPLRRRRLSDPVVPLGAAVQHARLHEQPGRGRQQARGSGPGRRGSKSTPTTKPIAVCSRAGSSATSSAGAGGR